MSYDKIAEIYDEYHPWWYDKEDEISYSKMEIKGRVLDMGCGTGTPLLNNICIQPSNYIGVDISLDMVELAQKYHPEYTFYWASAAENYSELEPFDTILLLFGTASYLTIEQIFSFKKYLSPGGKIYFHLYGRGRDQNSPTAELDKINNNIKTWNTDINLPCYNINPFNFLRRLGLSLGFTWQFLPKRFYAWSLYTIQK